MSEDTEEIEEIAVSDEIIAMLTELDEIMEKAKELEARRIKLRDALTNELILTGNEKVELPDGRKANVVQSERTQINETVLKKKLGPTVWKKVTKVVLDKDKLERLVDDGEVDITDVAEATVLIPNQPFIKFTGKKKEQSDAKA